VNLTTLLSSLDLGIFPLISLLLTLGIFSGVLIWACCRSREQIEADSRLWMDDDE
jgi:hypothetical protein